MRIAGRNEEQMKITTIHGEEMEVKHPWLLRRLSDKWNDANDSRIAEEGGNKKVKFGFIPGGDCYRPACVSWFACMIEFHGSEGKWVIVDASEAARIAGVVHLDGAFRIKGQMDIWRSFGDLEDQWEFIGEDREGSHFGISHADLCHALKGADAIKAELDSEIAEILRKEPHPESRDSFLAQMIGVEPAETEEAFLDRKLLAAMRIGKCRRILSWLSWNEIEWLALPK